jgi:hypothetical protein
MQGWLSCGFLAGGFIHWHLIFDNFAENFEMRLKIGDKVKFLNESGGGVVSKIISPSLVHVTIEDGFEIPVLAGELIRIEEEAPVDSPKHMFREDFKVDVEIGQELPSGEGNALRLSNRHARGSVEPGIYLGFVPEDQKWLITGLLDVYLVNHTPYDILYSVFLEKPDGAFLGFDYGSVEVESMVLLESVEREKIEKWEKGIVQVLFHPETGNRVLIPGSSSFKIKLPRFYKEGNYMDSAIIDGKSMLISLLPLAAQQSLGTNEAGADKDQKMGSTAAATEVKPQHLIDKHRTSPREAVVDLHIEELVEDHSGMDSSQILRTQINYFTQCLENAMVNELSRVTFIHGVGTGVLKTAIKEILKEYPNVEVRDASRTQFGYGALEVVFS